MNVLVVDDDALTRKMVAHVLSKSGHLVTEVGDGAAALAVLEQRPYDVVMTDWNMPGLSGPELCRQIAASKTPRPRIVMLTSHDDEDHRAVAMASGVDAYLHKPFQVDEVLRAVEQTDYSLT